jgi:hypothetical protein
MELKITWKLTLRVWWSFFWRLLISLAAAFILSIGVGLAFGYVTVWLGLPIELMKIVGGFIGWCMGLLTTIVPMRLILGKNFGRFRLALVSTDGTEQS